MTIREQLLREKLYRTNQELFALRAEKQTRLSSGIIFLIGFALGSLVGVLFL